MQAYRETIDYMYGDNPQVLKDYAEFARIPEATAKRVRDEFFPKELLQTAEIKGLNSLIPDAVELKYHSRAAQPAAARRAHPDPGPGRTLRTSRNGSGARTAAWR